MNYKVIVPVAFCSAVAIFVGGATFGQIVEPDPPAEIVTRTVTETVTETETETVTVYEVPDACLDLAELATKLSDAVAVTNDSVAAMLDIMSELRIAVAMGDSYAANELETRLRRIDSRLIPAAQTIGSQQEELPIVIEECENEQ